MKRGILISEAAKRYSISRPALIYYDTIGLLCPYHDVSTGYRYYSSKDLEKLEMILILKESGLPLKKIREFVENPSHSRGLMLLRKQREAVRDKILQLRRLEDLMDRRIRIFQEYEGMRFYQGIQIKHYDAISFSAEAVDYSRDNPLKAAMSSLKRKLDSVSESQGSIMSKYGFILPEDSLTHGRYLDFSHVIDYLNSPGDTVLVSASSPGDYAVSLHRGGIEKAGSTIKGMLEYIGKKGYTPAGSCYIIPLVDSWDARGEDDYISEILIPVAHKGE